MAEREVRKINGKITPVDGLGMIAVGDKLHDLDPDEWFEVYAISSHHDRLEDKLIDFSALAIPRPSTLPG